MKVITNRFGTGNLYEKSDLGKSIYCTCTACMSIWSDFLSFANHELNNKDNKDIIDVTPYFCKGDSFLKDTDTIVVLGCQVTDLAIYNDIETAKELHNKYPDLPIYMGGCLAYRFDIELPEYIRRLEVVREAYENLKYVDGFIDYKKPFWNKDLKDDAEPLETGNLFRHMYPLKIGAGCSGKCKYCTIRDTRGESYETDAYLQVSEYLEHAGDREKGVVLISDSPSVEQIKDWCHIAMRYKKQISFRNVEPQVAILCKNELLELANNKLLYILHCPIQSHLDEVLKSMNRNIKATNEFITFAQELRNVGVIVATNIIIDYTMDDGEIVSNLDEAWMNNHFDYWSWNPYFDGNFDYQKALGRFNKYIV